MIKQGFLQFVLHFFLKQTNKQKKECHLDLVIVIFLNLFFWQQGQAISLINLQSYPLIDIVNENIYTDILVLSECLIDCKLSKTFLIFTQVR